MKNRCRQMYKTISQLTFTCSKSNTKKGVFVVNIEYNSHLFFSASIGVVEQVSVSWVSFINT